MAVCRDDDDLIHSFVDTGFEEERDIIEDDSMRIFSGGLFRESGLFVCNSRMDDSLQPPEFLFVVKDDRTQSVTVDRVIGIQDVLTERPDYLAPGRFPGPDNLSCQLISIDHDGAASPEHFRDGAFPARHPPSQANKHHGGGAYHAVCRTTKSD